MALDGGVGLEVGVCVFNELHMMQKATWSVLAVLDCRFAGYRN